MSKVSVSMKMSPKQAGALYMKCMKLEDELKQLESERDFLSATVERLRDLFEEGFESGEDHDLDAWEEKAKAVLEATPRQNLNAVKREVAREAILSAIEDYKREYCGQGIESLLSSFADIYPAKRYPDKE